MCVMVCQPIDGMVRDHHDFEGIPSDASQTPLAPPPLAAWPSLVRWRLRRAPSPRRVRLSKFGVHTHVCWVFRTYLFL
jgi:hypothetical protein